MTGPSNHSTVKDFSCTHHPLYDFYIGPRRNEPRQTFDLKNCAASDRSLLNGSEESCKLNVSQPLSVTPESAATPGFVQLTFVGAAVGLCLTCNVCNNSYQVG